MTPLCKRISPYPFFEATTPGAAPGPPVKTGARVRRFRECNKARLRSVDLVLSPASGSAHRVGLRRLGHNRSVAPRNRCHKERAYRCNQLPPACLLFRVFVSSHGRRAIGTVRSAQRVALDDRRSAARAPVTVAEGTSWGDRSKKQHVRKELINIKRAKRWTALLFSSRKPKPSELQLRNGALLRRTPRPCLAQAPLPLPISLARNGRCEGAVDGDGEAVRVWGGLGVRLEGLVEGQEVREEGLFAVVEGDRLSSRVHRLYHGLRGIHDRGKGSSKLPWFFCYTLRQGRHAQQPISARS